MSDEPSVSKSTNETVETNDTGHDLRQTSLHPPATHPRKLSKVARACLACSRRKKRCDGEHPTCAYCQKKNLVCNYNWDHEKKLLKQIQKWECVLVPTTVSPTTTTFPDPLESPFASPINRLANTFASVNMDASPLLPQTTLIPEALGTFAQPGFNFSSLTNQLLQSFNNIRPVDVSMFPGSQTLLSAPILPTPGVGLQNGGMQYFDSLFKEEPTAESVPIISGPSFSNEDSSSPGTTLPPFHDSLSTEETLSLLFQHNRSVSGKSSLATSSPDFEETKPELPMFKFFPELSTVAVEEKPDAGTYMDLLVCYFRYVYPLMPILHRVTLIKGVTNPKPWNSGPGPLLLNAMLSVSARFHPEHAHLQPYFFKQAKTLLYEELDNPNLETVQALLHLILYASAQGTMGSLAWMYVGLSVKLAEKLRLFIEPEDLQNTTGVKMSWMEKELRRRTWWACYFFDRQAAAGADRLCMINDKMCRCSLPCNLLIFEGVEEIDHETGKVILDPKQPRVFPIAGSRVDLTALNNNAHWSETLAWADLPEQQRRMLDPEQMGTPVFPGHGKLDPFGQIVVLCCIFGKIMDFHDECNRLGIDPFEESKTLIPAGEYVPADSPGTGHPAHRTRSFPSTNAASTKERIAHLNGALEDWWMCLKPIYRDIDTDAPLQKEGLITETEKQTGMQLPSYFSAFLHVFYHSVHIILHRPRDLTTLVINQAWLRSPSFVKCCEHAFKLTGIIKNCLKHNPTMDLFNPFYSFCIFQAGLIHAFAVKSLSSGVKDTMTRELFTEAQDAVMVDIQALKALSVRWKSAGMQGELLEMIVKDLKAPLVDGFGLMMLGDTQTIE